MIEPIEKTLNQSEAKKISDFSNITFSSERKPVTGSNLEKKWIFWKKQFLTEEGFVKDPSKNNRIVSEGLGYGLILALLFDDQLTFDQIFQSAKKIQKENYLFSWLLNNVDHNSASDADQDIAFALISAENKVKQGKWKNTQQNYGQNALKIINSIWEKEVKKTAPFEFLVLMPSDNQEAFIKEGKMIINPSYFSPAWYRLFASVDKNHPWLKLADNSILILEKIQEKFKTPVDWCFLEISKNGKILVSEIAENSYGLPKRTKIFGFDAVRVPLRLAIDVALYKNEKSKKLCEEILKNKPPSNSVIENSTSTESWHNELVTGILAGCSFYANSKNKNDYLREFLKFDQNPSQQESYYGPKYWEPAKNFYYNQTLTLISHLLIEGYFENLTAK